jgi:hypothetical protein
MRNFGGQVYWLIAGYLRNHASGATLRELWQRLSDQFERWPKEDRLSSPMRSGGFLAALSKVDSLRWTASPAHFAIGPRSRLDFRSHDRDAGKFIKEKTRLKRAQEPSLTSGALSLPGLPMA